MILKQKLRNIYRNIALPVLRGVATPCFRLAVKTAAGLRILPRALPLAADKREHFLVLHVSPHVGDTVMLLPMIEALRDAHPNARIECAVQVPMGSLLRLIPSLDHVYEFALDQGPAPTPRLELRLTLVIVRTYWRTMRHARPTTCIVPRWGSGFRDLMLSYLTQAPNRIGFYSNDFDRSHPPAGYRDALLTRCVRGAQRMAEPAKFLFLLEQAGLIPPGNYNPIGSRPNPSMLHIASTVNWSALADRVGIDPSARLAVVAPAASAPRKMWPIDRWSKVIDGLHAEGFTVVVLTGARDAPVARQLYELVPVSCRDRTILVAGICSLPESTCLIAHSRLFVGNDSGPGHIAGALGVPCVILFIAAEGTDPDGPSAPERIRPMGQRVVCCRPGRIVPPCAGYCTADCAHCILHIYLDDTLRAIESIMKIGDNES